DARGRVQISPPVGDLPTSTAIGTSGRAPPAAPCTRPPRVSPREGSTVRPPEALASPPSRSPGVGHAGAGLAAVARPFVLVAPPSSVRHTPQRCSRRRTAPP